MPRYSSNVVEPMQRSSPLASAGLIRLEASIVPPRGAGADDGVDLVDEQDRVGIFFSCASTAFSRSSKSPRYLVPATSAPCRARRWSRPSAPPGFALHDPALGQALGQRGLADAGLAHVQRVVLAPAAQHLDGALDFVRAADQRVDAAFDRARWLRLLAIPAARRPCPRLPARLRPCVPRRRVRWPSSPCLAMPCEM